MCCSVARSDFLEKFFTCFVCNFNATAFFVGVLVMVMRQDALMTCSQYVSVATIHKETE